MMADTDTPATLVMQHAPCTAQATPGPRATGKCCANEANKENNNKGSDNSTIVVVEREKRKTFAACGTQKKIEYKWLADGRQGTGEGSGIMHKPKAIGNR